MLLEQCQLLNQRLTLQCMHFDLRPSFELYKRGRARKSLAFSGSNQARKGRLVDALAVRGDERRDTLR
jgi:hypothetical protein